MEVETLIIGRMQTNTYLVIDADGSAVVIDPADEWERIVKHCAHKQIVLKGILVTHGHFDHIGAVDAIRNHLDIPVYAHEIEARMMADGDENLSFTFYGQHITAIANHLVSGGDIIDLGGDLLFKCIQIEGHTDASLCFYNEQHHFVITGDTLMSQSIGRTDFHGGDTAAFIQSMADKLLTLPQETVVYPGHGPSTQIGIEKERNLFF